MIPVHSSTAKKGLWYFPLLLFLGVSLSFAAERALGQALAATTTASLQGDDWFRGIGTKSRNIRNFWKKYRRETSLRQKTDSTNVEVSASASKKLVASATPRIGNRPGKKPSPASGTVPLKHASLKVVKNRTPRVGECTRKAGMAQLPREPSRISSNPGGSIVPASPAPLKPCIASSGRPVQLVRPVQVSAALVSKPASLPPVPFPSATLSSPTGTLSMVPVLAGNASATFRAVPPASETLDPEPKTRWEKYRESAGRMYQGIGSSLKKVGKYFRFKRSAKPAATRTPALTTLTAGATDSRSVGTEKVWDRVKVAFRRFKSFWKRPQPNPPKSFPASGTPNVCPDLSSNEHLPHEPGSPAHGKGGGLPSGKPRPPLSAAPPAPIVRPPEPEETREERKLEISGTKTFEVKKAEVKGDIGHFSTEHYDSIPGFHMDQSLHLEIQGEISRNAAVNAVLDDKEDEERRFTVNIDGPKWDFVMGDFPIFLQNSEFALNRKEVRGILAKGEINPHFNTIFLFSQSKGLARREQFRGAGDQQEFRLLGSPVVMNSERVTIDGGLLARGTDYIIDYEDGILRFQARVLPIEPTSWIVVEYEVTDKKLAFKRNTLGCSVEYIRDPERRLSVSYLDEYDASVPKSENSASGTVRPVDHRILDLEGKWPVTPSISLAGETSISLYDPNKNSEETEQDKSRTGNASRLSLLAHGRRLSGEVGFRRIDKEFRLIGRESGVTQLGERGLVSDILKGNGRLNFALRKNLQLFMGLEKSKTNLSADPTLSKVDFTDVNGGATWKYGPKNQLEGRVGKQMDREASGTPLLDRDKNVGTLVWDHDFGKVFSQVKVENTAYVDSLIPASDTKVLNMGFNVGCDKNKKFLWTVAASRLTFDDESERDQIRNETRNCSLDVNYEPNRIVNARGILQWRTEDDLLLETHRTDQVADSRIRLQPNRDCITQLKYKVENTSKIVRDSSLDAAKFILPSSLLNSSTAEEIVSRFENPVRKTSANVSTNYRLSEKVETNIDWKRRDVKDRATQLELSNNDRRTFEVRYTPFKQLRLSTEYESGKTRTLSPIYEMKDTVKRIELRDEFWEGYILDSRLEDRDENDIFANENDKRTRSGAVDFQRVFSKFATLEMGVQRNIIDFRQPSREWEKRAAFVLTPSSRNQRYKLFFSHKEIDSAQPGNVMEGGLNFSQYIGTDSMIDGEVKRVKSSATLNGNGYEATVANGKMVITF